MIKNILIAGGAGFIGSNLSLKLVSLGYDVTVMDNLSPQIHGERSPLYESIKSKVSFIHGDVRNKSDWLKALYAQDAVIHLAAETGTGQSMYEIEKYLDVNIKGTAILLDILTNEPHTIKKMLVASSRAIYGEGSYQCERHGKVFPEERSEKYMSSGDFEAKCPICDESVSLVPTDEESKIHPTSIYGISKQNQEQMVMVVGKAIDIPAVALRYQNVYGPGQSLTNPYTGILSIFSTRMKNNNSIDVFEDGQESRDFVYIDDAVEATVQALLNDASNYQIYNVGSGVPTTVYEVASKLKEIYCSDVDISITSNYRLGDIRHNYADLSKIQDQLSFSPQVGFHQGIERFAQWVNTQEVGKDQYEKSIQEMKEKGLFK